MEIRKYRKSDLEAIVRLFHDTVHKVNIRDYSQEQVDAWAPDIVDLDAWDRALARNYTFVACEGAIVVGFGDIDETGYLDRLYVRHDCQGIGVASRLCDVLEAAVDVDMVTVHASVTARAFFVKRGYVVVRMQTVARQGVTMTNFLMRRNFKGT